MAVNELLAQLHEVAVSPKKQLEKYLSEGKKVVAVAPVYTPQEIIHSMGLVPMGVWGADMEINEAKKYYPAFICSIMQTILELGIKGEYDGVSAIVIPSLCHKITAAAYTHYIAHKSGPKQTDRETDRHSHEYKGKQTDQVNHSKGNPALVRT